MKIKKEWLGFGPLGLCLGLLFVVLSNDPYPTREELIDYTGTVEEVRRGSSGWRGRSSYIRIWTGSDLLKFGVSWRNSIIKGEPIIVRAEEYGNWGNVAWELEQNGRVIYSLEQRVSSDEKKMKFLSPMYFLFLSAGIFLTPFWFINWRKNRTKVRSLF